MKCAAVAPSPYSSCPVFVQADECICRLSEVLDWDMGGRTSAADVHRIFVKELEAGPTKVTTVLRTGTNGVAFCTALNRCAAYPELPEYSDDRRGTCIWGEPHASLLALIRANFAAELTDEVVVNIAAREEEEGKRRSAEAKRLVRRCCCSQGHATLGVLFVGCWAGLFGMHPVEVCMRMSGERVGRTVAHFQVPVMCLSSQRTVLSNQRLLG